MNLTDPQEAEAEALQLYNSCSEGHRSTLSIQTQQGGLICLLCFSNLLTTPRAPTLHISYALSQLSLALSLRPLLPFHACFLVSPLLHALSSFDDQPIACQIIDVITTLCASGNPDVLAEFVSRVAVTLSSGALAWSRRQLYMLHCFGVLLNCQTNALFGHIKDKDALISNLVSGLELPSEEIRGEILFVLYKVSSLQCTSMDGDGDDVLFACCPKLLRLSLEALMKTQNDDVRLNCVALLTILAQKGYFINANANEMSSMSFTEADNCMETNEDGEHRPSLNVLFADAIKGPLLSSDSQVQISTLDLIFHFLSEGVSGKRIQVLVEENIADYIFEILRLSECKDSMVNSCLQVLNLLSTAEQVFKQRLFVGFTTLIPVLHHVTEVPFHPVQSLILKLIYSCISSWPEMLPISHVEDLILCLTMMFKRNADGEMGMLTETFTMACSIIISILKSPSLHGTLNVASSVQEVSKHAILSCLSSSWKDPSQLLHSLYLLKEAYIYSYGQFSIERPCNIELRNLVINVCRSTVLPWFLMAFDEINEEVVLGVLETFHSIMLQHSDIQITEFAKILVSSSWFSLSYACLGLFPSEKIKWKVYLMLGSLVDVLLGSDTGHRIRDAVSYIPSDPVDLLFLLGQKSSDNLELSSCQLAVLLILHTSALYNDRLADETLVLASIEQYVLVNHGNFQCGSADSLTIMWLVNLYGLYRSLTKKSCQIPYSPEAERILFYLMTENEWDLPSAMIHPLSLRWLFQQEKIDKLLSCQILRFSRSNGTDVVVNGKCDQTVNEKVIAELVAADDNHAASLFISLLMKLVEQDGEIQDILSVVNFMEKAIEIFPDASDQLCLHGIGSAIHALYYNSNQFSSESFAAISLLTFKILCSVHPEVLYDDGVWLPVTTKLIDYLISKVALDSWTHESLLVISILSLILYHSTNNALVNVSKTIILNTSLISTIHSTIDAACSKGPAMIDYDEGTSTGEKLILVLLLCFFSLRSLHAVLPGAVEWQNFLDPLNSKQLLPVISIHCHDLCRLMHFGSPSVKLVSSYCLLELFRRLSDQNDREHEELKCSMSFLMSMMAVLEGLVLCSDIRVAMNCGLCLSMILGWEKMDMKDRRITEKNYWCRLIVEEMAMSLAVPCLASKSLFNRHKPAVHVAVALLKLDQIPRWMRTVFDDSCISAIIGNLRPNNISTEIVLLFQELRNSEFLKAGQIAKLNHVFQSCRKYLYVNNSQDDHSDEPANKSPTLYNLGEVREYLILLMSSQSSVDRELHVREEIEKFLSTG